MLLNQPYNINPNHNGKANDNVRDKCLVAVNTYGYSPIKLLNTINTKKDRKIKV